MKRMISVLIIAIMLVVFTLPAFAAGSVITLNAYVDSTSKVVTIVGTLSPAVPSNVTVVVKNPSGELDYVDQMMSGIDGKYSFSYKLDETNGGSYSVSVGCNGVISAGSFTYTVVPTGPIPTPIPTPGVTPAPTPTPVPAAFTDVEGNWAKKAIMELAKAGILSGYSDGTVRPNASATRAEFINMVMKLMKQEAKTTASFTDTTASAWYMKALSLAVEKGWIKGRDDGSFGPDDKITREEAIVIISRVLDSLGEKAAIDPSVLDSFSDSANISSWAKADVARLVGLGIIKGYDGMINPKTEITRAEISTIIVRVMEGYMNN